MNCDLARETLSAAADGEAPDDQLEVAHGHIAGCAECRDVVSRMARLDRSIRLRPAEPVPDLVPTVMARSRPAQLGRGGWLRPALAWVAVVMAIQNLPALVLGNTDGTEAHLSRHLGAFGVALAIGFAFIAYRPHRAFGLLPLVTALVVTMLASTAFDMIDGGRSPLAETVHLTELVGLALLWMIAGSPGWNGFHRHRTSGHRTSVG